MEQLGSHFTDFRDEFLSQTCPWDSSFTKFNWYNLQQETSASPHPPQKKHLYFCKNFGHGHVAQCLNFQVTASTISLHLPLSVCWLSFNLSIPSISSHSQARLYGTFDLDPLAPFLRHKGSAFGLCEGYVNWFCDYLTSRQTPVRIFFWNSRTALWCVSWYSTKQNVLRPKIFLLPHKTYVVPLNCTLHPLFANIINIFSVRWPDNCK